MPLAAMTDAEQKGSVTAEQPTEHHEATVTPWEVEGDVDYEKLIKRFGSQVSSVCDTIFSFF